MPRTVILTALGVEVQLALGAAVGDIIRFTGIQLEVGEQATPFEHRSYADELARCQRYFFKLTDISGDGAGTFGHRYNNDSAKRTIEILYPTTMRTSPSLTVIAQTPLTLIIYSLTVPLV